MEDNGEATVALTAGETPDEMDTSKDVPKEYDTSNLIFSLFYLLGTVSFVPQNFYVTANDYWMYKFRDINETYINSTVANKTALQKNFTAYYSTVANVCFMSFLFITIAVAKKIPLQIRILGSLSIMLILFFLTLVFIQVDTDSWQRGFFILSLTIGGFLTASGACFMLSVFQLSSKFPPVYLGAQLSGQSICGVLAALTQIFALLLNASFKTTAMIYFSTCALLILGSMTFYLIVFHRSDSFQGHLNKEDDQEVDEKLDFSKFKTVLRKLSLILITMVLTAGGGVIIFPGVISLVESEGKGTSRWSDVFFVPVCTFLSYHLWDFIGREFSLRWLRFKNVYVILTVSILRLIFIPLLMLCNVQPRNNLPVVFTQDYAYIIFVIIFAFSTGYFMNLCIMQIPSMVEPEENKLSMVAVIVVMVVSLGTCSLLTNVVVHSI